MESMYFIFDGVKSSDMDLYIMRIEHGGFIETPYMGGLDIEEEKISKRLTPYFYGVNREPIEFTVQFVPMDRRGNLKEWTPQERYKIGKWLIHDTYKPFQTSDDLGKYYYAMITEPVDISTMNRQGYMEVTFRTNSPFAWSPVYIDSFDLSDNTAAEIKELENNSNVLKYYRPKIEFELVGDTTDVQFRNLSNGGRVMKFENLIPNEIISIDCENEIIKSNRQTSNPFSKFNIGMRRYWLDLVYGINHIEITGAIKLYVKSQFPIAQ